MPMRPHGGRGQPSSESEDPYQETFFTQSHGQHAERMPSWSIAQWSSESSGSHKGQRSLGGNNEASLLHLHLPIQWTAAEMDGMRCNGLLRLCKFMFLVCAFMLDANWPHPTHQPWFLVSNFAIRKLVLIYIHKKETKDSQRSSCSPFLLFVMFSLAPSVMFSFLSFSLAPYLSLPEHHLPKT